MALRSIKLVSFFLLLFAGFVAHAQILTPVKWDVRSEMADGKTYLVFDAKIDDGWTVYSQYLESEDGPVATTINYDTPKAIKLIGKAEETGKRKAGYDKLFDMEVVKFSKTYSIRQEVQFTGDAPVVGYLNFMTCDSEKCLPPSDVEFELSKPTSPATGSIKAPAKEGVVASNSILQSEKLAPVVPAKEMSSVPAAKEVEAQQATPAPKKGLLNPVTWTFSTEQIEGNRYRINAIAAIQQDWTVYSQEVDPGGPVATTFGFEKVEGAKLIGKVEEKGNKKSGLDPVFEVNVTKFVAPEATFSQEVEVEDDNGMIVGYLEFMSCDKSQCLPPTERYYQFIPAQGIARELDYDQFESVLAGDGVVVTPPSGPVSDPNSQYTIDNELDKATCGEDSREVNVADDASWFTIFFLGFGGGLLALLTPCVFPMIPLTVSFFTGRGKDRKKGLQRALIYGASIIGIYVTLGLVITGVFGADALNLLSTNAWFNLAFGVMFVVFALSFFGFFEITLPSSWANKSDRAADQGGLLGIFFMAFTLSIVSFSCTGPIIGTLLVETATGGGATIFGRIPVAPLIGMLGFSSALAFPFTLFAAFPSALASLPKSGGWMNTVKVTLGFVEIALAMKFLSTADLIMGTKWMPYELFIGVWVLCALGLAAYYFGYLKTPLEKFGAQKVSNITMLLGAGMLAFAVYVGMGYRYNEQSHAFNTPALLSGLAPPAGHSYVYENHCPQNLNCYKDYDEALAYAKTVNKPVLVDFTGHGCVNCRKMEDNVWDKPGVYDKINEDYVLVSLYVDEREALDEPFTSTFSDQKIRTVGNKWADFQARYFNRNSQPYYVLMTPEGQVLNQPVPYTPDVEAYEAFLDCGLQQFKKVKSGTATPGSLGAR
ncbi:MAG: protein-disulfide reductase DsbD family protein [Saprospiraceae bacterium]